MAKKEQDPQGAINLSQHFTVSKRMVFYLIIGLGVAWIAYFYRSVLSSLILGGLLAYLLSPAVDFLSKKLRVPSRLSIWLVFISFLVLIVSVTRSTAPIVYRQVKVLTSDFQLISDELIGLQPILDKILDVELPLDEVIGELEGELNQLLIPNRLFQIIRSATDNFIWLLVTLMTCLYLLIDHAKLTAWIYQTTPESMQEYLKHIQGDVDLIWKTYFRGQFVLMVIIGVLSGIGGVAVGLRNALIIGVLAGFLELIPSLGPTIAMIIAGVTAWTQGSSYLQISNIWFAILVCAIFIFIQLVENTILVPRIMSKRMNLHPALVFIAIVSTLALFGVIASLIVIPVITSLGVIIKYVFQQPNAFSGEGSFTENA